MSKIDIKIKLNGVEENIDLTTSAIKNKNKINYNENNIKVTILLQDNKIEMKRLCNEYEINLIFEENKKTMSSYQVFGMPKIFYLETKTKKLIITKNKIELEYELEGNSFYYLLEMEAL